MEMLQQLNLQRDHVEKMVQADVQLLASIDKVMALVEGDADFSLYGVFSADDVIGYGLLLESSLLVKAPFLVFIESVQALVQHRLRVNVLKSESLEKQIHQISDTPNSPYV